MPSVGRTVRVYLNETCNQGCAFCDRRASRERPAFVAPEAARRRIEEASHNAAVMVLTGGEPTMRRDLVALVAHAAARGVQVELETNAALITIELAHALRRAGLTKARVHLPAWGDACDRVTRDPGGFAATRRGVEALVDAALSLEIAAPVVRANEASLAELPRHLAAAGWPVAALVVGVPARSPEPSALLSFQRAASVVARVAAHARTVGLDVRLDPHAPLPPCAFAHPARFAHLFALTRGGAVRAGWSRRDPCDRCVVADRCPGVPGGTTFEPRPLLGDRVRRRLSVISTVRQQVERELYQDEIVRLGDGAMVRARTVRVGFACNQACDFCFVSTHLPAAPEDAVADAIVVAARRGDAICLSGGEPLLDPQIERWVRLAKEEGASWVELQTNATRVNATRARMLREAGVDVAFVSLHGATAAVSDAVTGAPGTFAQTCAGIDALMGAGVPLRLNFVFCEINMAEFPAHVTHVATRWPGAELCVSFVAASTDLVPRTTRLIPRYSAILPYLREGLALAAEADLRVSGFDSMCGLPLCLVPEDVVRIDGMADVPNAYRGDEVVHPPVCKPCVLRRKCFGLRRGYADLYGTAELRPVCG